LNAIPFSWAQGTSSFAADVMRENDRGKKKLIVFNLIESQYAGQVFSAGAERKKCLIARCALLF